MGVELFYNREGKEHVSPEQLSAELSKAGHSNSISIEDDVTWIVFNSPSESTMMLSLEENGVVFASLQFNDDSTEIIDCADKVMAALGFEFHHEDY